jgi:mannitol operon repressor
VSPWDNAPPEIKTLATFLDYFYKESDRGAALLAGSMLDEILFRIIRAYLIEDAQAEMLLTGFNAPLGTFNARIAAAYALCLIEPKEFAEANVVRKIRNEFAHTWGDLRFDHATVAGLVGNLRTELFIPDTPDPSTPRSKFNNAVANLLGEWLWREGLVKKERRTPKAWPHKAGFLKGYS